ncbi:phosphorylase family protein [Streptomyces griseomycini]|uniref:phosphorylase family protein n=1 Tax=Streptomyces griseomycini TaxID=66895 RepID=UPI001E39CBFC|nr:hypothetical protein [Streptomyces griseomycini]
MVPDRLVDRTSGRIQTSCDEGAVHVPFADPSCEHGRAALLEAAAAAGIEVVDDGTMVVVEGPRSSPRRVAVVRAAGWSLVNMTGRPEAVLARELALGYPAVARVTGLDAGIDAAENVVQEVVLKVFAENTQRLRRVVLVVIGMFPMTTTPLPPAHSTAWTCPSNCPEPVHTGTRRDEPSQCRRAESRRVRGRAPGRLSGRRRRPRCPGPLWR